MSKPSQMILRLAVLSAVGVGLMSCDAIRRAAGDEKSAPDEFAVLTKAPLIIPPDYNLRPPAPGAAPVNQQEPTDAAEAAMFGPTDPQTVAAGIPGNFSPAERMFLANAGVQNTDPAIRTELQGDEKSMQGADQSFTDRLLYGKPDDAGRAVNADAEINQAKGAAKTKDSATIEKKSSNGGWFDWF